MADGLVMPGSYAIVYQVKIKGVCPGLGPYQTPEHL
jgi:hypothetical protein